VPQTPHLRLGVLPSPPTSTLCDECFQSCGSVSARATTVYNSSGLEYYRHADWLGSARLTSTPSRTVTGDLAYAPFGETYASSGSPDVSFTGQNPDTNANLYDFMYREYGIQGRWPSQDPPRCLSETGAVRIARIGPLGSSAFNLADPQSLNLYAYVRNTPTSFVDPLGLDECPAGTVVVVSEGGTGVQTQCVPIGGSGFGGGTPCSPFSFLATNCDSPTGTTGGAGGALIGPIPTSPQGLQNQTPHMQGPPYVCSGTAQFLDSLDFTTKLGLDVQLSKALSLEVDTFKNNQTGEKGAEIGGAFAFFGVQLQRLVPAGADITSNSGSNVFTVNFGPFQYSSQSGWGWTPASSISHFGGALLVGGDVSFNSQRASQISAQCGGG
jgi:RHS repeat-associated protein